MTYLSHGGGPGDGLFPAFKDVVVTNRAAGSGASGVAVLGDVVEFDLINTDAAVTDNTPGSSTSGFSNVKIPITASEPHGIFGVVNDLLGNAGADDAKMQVRVYGIVDCNCIMSSGSIVKGDELYIDVSVEPNGLTAVAITVDEPAVKVFAIALEAQTTPTALTATSVWFNGITGWGTLCDAT